MFLGTDVSINFNPTEEERKEIETLLPKAFKKLKLGTLDAMPGTVCDMLGCDCKTPKYTTEVSDEVLRRALPAFLKHLTEFHHGELTAFDQMAHFTDILFAARKLGCSVTIERF